MGTNDIMNRHLIIEQSDIMLHVFRLAYNLCWSCPYFSIIMSNRTFDYCTRLESLLLNFYHLLLKLVTLI